MSIGTRKKTLSKLVLASLLISCLPVPLPARAAQSPMTISKQEIDQKIARIKKVTKKLRRTRNIATLAVFGVGLALTVALITASIGLYFYIGKSPERIGADPTKINVLLGKIIIGTVIAALVSGIATGPAALFSRPAIFTIFGGLSARSISSAIIETKKLEMTESNYPDTLNKKQKKIIARFKKTIKGPILKGIIKGIQLKKALAATTQTTLRRNPRLLAQLGGANKAYKTIKKYLNLSWQKRNLQMAVDAYNIRKEKLKTARDKHKKWTPTYHMANTKLLALKVNPRYLAVKLQNKKLGNKIKKLQKKQGTVLEKKSIANAIQQFMQKADTIVQDLKKLK